MRRDELCSRLELANAALDVAGGAIVCTRPVAGVTAADLAEHGRSLLGAYLTPVQRAAVALARVNEPGVRLRVGGVVLESCPDVDAQINRPRIAARVLQLVSLGEPSEIAARRAVMESGYA